MRRCLAKQLVERFQSMSEVRRALEVLAGKICRTQAVGRGAAVFDHSADKEDEYFSDGLAEEIINALAHIRRPQRHRAHFLILVPRQGSGYPESGRDVGRADHSSGQRAAIGKSCPYNRTVRSTPRMGTTSGPKDMTGKWRTYSRFRTRLRKRLRLRW